jgi:TolA-binding protein
MTRKIAVILFYILYVVAPLPAQEKEAPLNLAKIADDFKFRNGIAFIKLGRYDRAVEELQEYLEIYSHGIHRHEAFKNIAEIYFSQFQYQKAQQVYHLLYEEFSDTDEGTEAYYMIGVCYQKMGQDEKAGSIFKDIMKKHAGSGYAYQAAVQVDLLNIINEEEQ